MNQQWVVIHIAHSQASADAARELLEREGFMVRLSPIAKQATSGEAYFEVMTLPTEAKEARDLILESLL